MNMKRLQILWLGIACTLLATGCQADRKTSPERTAPTVITVSIEPLRYLAEQIAGDGYEVNTLVPKGSSPETYEPTPKQMMNLSESKVCLTVGDLGFERTWGDKLRQAAPDVPFVRTADGITRTAGHTHSHKGEAMQENDPHVWTSPACMKIIAKNICTALCRLDTAQAEKFQARLRQALQTIQATDDSIRTLLGTSSSKAFLIYHPALTYFAEDYGWTQISIETDGKEPSPAQLARIIQTCKEKQVRTIFVQQEFDRKNAELIAKETGTRIATINPLSYDWTGELLKIAHTLHDQ